ETSAATWFSVRRYSASSFACGVRSSWGVAEIARRARGSRPVRGRVCHRPSAGVMRVGWGRIMNGRGGSGAAAGGKILRDAATDGWHGQCVAAVAQRFGGAGTGGDAFAGGDRGGGGFAAVAR